MSEEKYFQSSVSALAFGHETDDRFDHIISRCMKIAGEEAWSQIDEDQISERKEWILRSTTAPDDFKKSTTAHWHILYGAAILNVRCGSVEASIKRAKTLSDYIHQHEARNGTDAQFRIKAEYAWRTRKGDMSYRHFSILVALYSVIGSNPKPVLITRDMIRCRALGYKTPAVMAAEFSKRIDGAQPLTDKQIRDDLDRLQVWGYFARVNPAKKSRRAYFSHRLTEDEMIAAVAEKEFYRRKLSASKPAASDKIQALVAEKLTAVLSGPLLSGPRKPKRTRQGPDLGQTGATAGPVEGQTGATYNINTLNRNIPNTNTLNRKSINEPFALGEIPEAATEVIPEAPKRPCGWCSGSQGVINLLISPDQPICPQCQLRLFASKNK